MKYSDDSIAHLIGMTNLTTTGGTTTLTIVELIEYVLTGAITFSSINTTTGITDSIIGRILAGTTLSTTLLGTSMSSSPISQETLFMQNTSSCDEPIIFDKKEHSKIEKTAEKVYDTFNKGHESNTTQSLLLPNMELAEQLDQILKSNNKDTLYQALTALQETIEEIEKTKEPAMKLNLK